MLGRKPDTQFKRRIVAQHWSSSVDWGNLKAKRESYVELSCGHLIEADSITGWQHFMGVVPCPRCAEEHKEDTPCKD